MKKLAVIISLLFVTGCWSNTITFDSNAVFITESPDSDNVIYDGNSIAFVVDKKTRNIALLEISGKDMTPKVLVMPFTSEGLEHFRTMLGAADTERGEIVPLDIVKNNRGDYLSCVLLRNFQARDTYVMCEMNGTDLKDASKRRSIFFTMDFNELFGLTYLTSANMSGNM